MARRKKHNKISVKKSRIKSLNTAITAQHFQQLTSLKYHCQNHVGKSRSLHIHENAPGVLTKINEAFAHNNINISAQYLQTDDKIGYVVIDVDSEDAEAALKEVEKIEGTIRARLLH